MKFNDVARERLKSSLGRLLKLMEMNAPAEVIGREMALFIPRVVAVYGATVMAAMGRAMIAREQKLAGFCSYCTGEPNPTALYDDICEACMKSTETEDEDDEEEN